MTWTTADRTAYSKRWRLDDFNGRRRWVDATPAREVVLAFSAAGFSPNAIASAAPGVDSETIRNLAKGTYPRVRRRVAEVVCRVTIPAILAAAPPRCQVPATGAQRRVRALLALGWTHADLTAAIGQSTNAMANNRKSSVTRATHDAVRAVYAARSMTPGPSVRTRLRAARMGYAPPLAWDDDTIDDPTAVPNMGRRDGTHDGSPADDAVIDRVLSGRPHATNVAEREAVIPRLVARGMNDHEIAALVGVAPETVLRTRKRLGVESRWVA